MKVELIARCVRGIEYAVADEITALMPGDLTLGAREVRFQVPPLDAAVCELRTPDDIFLSVGRVEGVGHRKDVLPGLAEQVRQMDWRTAVETLARVRDLSAPRRFDVVASLVGRRNYSRYDVEDAVGSALSGELGARYISRRPAASASMQPVALSIRLFISADTAGIAIRLAAGPLHRRSYKRDASRGTLHPPMAAVLARLLSVAPYEAVLDPFCGDGTILIEIAEIAPGADIRGSDLDPARVDNAVANAARAGTDIPFSVMDAGRLDLGDRTIDVLAANPPWNLAVDATGLLKDGLGQFWAEASRVISPVGRMGIIVDAELSVSAELRRLGYQLPLVQTVRLAGRLSEIILGTPPGRPHWTLPDGIARWRREALAAGLVSDSGFEAKTARC
ncbi:MAG: methyltransferase domain-containing protein [Streptosporangiaceae bacterium]|jgi:23S rRNA G2445 N2-methylase RlmL